MTSPIFIPDLFSTIVKKVATAIGYPVYFDYGHYNEVTRNLTQKDRSISQRDKKYPLIWLVMDYIEEFGELDYEYCRLPDLQFIIAVPTSAAKTTSDRITDNFKTILYPIYVEFKNQIQQSGYFNNADPLKHEKIDRPYWGGQDTLGNGQANLFNDFIDAIQLRRVVLNVNEICNE